MIVSFLIGFLWPAIIFNVVLDWKLFYEKMHQGRNAIANGILRIQHLFHIGFIGSHRKLNL